MSGSGTSDTELAVIEAYTAPSLVLARSSTRATQEERPGESDQLAVHENRSVAVVISGRRRKA